MISGRSRLSRADQQGGSAGFCGGLVYPSTKGKGGDNPKACLAHRRECNHSDTEGKGVAQPPQRRATPVINRGEKKHGPDLARWNGVAADQQLSLLDEIVEGIVVSTLRKENHND